MVITCILKIKATKMKIQRSKLMKKSKFIDKNSKLDKILGINVITAMCRSFAVISPATLVKAAYVEL